MLFSGFIVLGLAFLLYAGLFKVILCCFPNYILGCFLIYFERKVSIFRVRLMTSQIGVMTVFFNIIIGSYVNYMYIIWLYVTI